jgi:hypothetical protein
MAQANLPPGQAPGDEQRIYGIAGRTTCLMNPRTIPMKRMATPKRSLPMLLLVSMAILGACSTVPNQTPETAPAPAPEPQVVDDYEGDGMLLTLDGSSEEAFDASLARIGRHSDPKMFQTLQAALQYLSIYDLNIKGKKENLIKVMDGMNGYQVIDRVGWRVPDLEESPAAKPGANRTT